MSGSTEKPLIYGLGKLACLDICIDILADTIVCNEKLEERHTEPDQNWTYC